MIVASGICRFDLRFAVQVVLGIGVVVIMTGLAIGIAIESWKAAFWLTTAGSLAAVLPAIIVLFIMDKLGIRVGSGNAAMAKVMVFGSLAATLASGGLIGWVLAPTLSMGSMIEIRHSLNFAPQ